MTVKLWIFCVTLSVSLYLNSLQKIDAEGNIMTIKNLQAIVLAAGKSSRFKTGKSKLIEKICGREMILYITQVLERLKIPTTCIIGYQRELVKKIIEKYHNSKINFVIQEKQLGTGHAILCAQPTFYKDNILIINGDMPLIKERILEELYNKHLETSATISLVVSHNSDISTGAYGRIVRTNNSIEIIEAKDFKGDSHEHCYINAGIYIINRKFLEDYISTLSTNNASNEFYITDLVKIASQNGYTVTTVTAPFDQIRGINTLRELWVSEQIKRAEIIRYWMERGVRFSLAQTVHIDWDVKIEPGTYIDCNVHLLSGTRIGKNCTIKGFSSIENATIGDNSIIKSHSFIKNSSVGCNAKIGPFACIHEKSKIGNNTIIGNFVEIKKSKINSNRSTKRLTSFEQAEVGENVMPGSEKHKTGTEKSNTSKEPQKHPAKNNSQYVI